ncbi:hypothetical protein GH714_004523 [Hevea brasiliensis]|uniref:Uncharacterized protein n=1 Tax=Hevea brasiliensis TaxID=3981 RepID=A0A6A6M9Y2_HEVBR|nr:hypothetical protein GH714_004523 [Hevea brasiliensis]
MGDWVSSRTAAGPEGVGNFVNYLRQDEAVAAGLGAEEGGLDPVESQRVVDLLNRELSRWYDFPHRGAKGIVAGVIVGEHELSRRVFMVLYRISSNRDPGARAADTLSSRDHAGGLSHFAIHSFRRNEGIYAGIGERESANVKLQLCKLMKKGFLTFLSCWIYAMYGHENEELSQLLVENALQAQTGIHDNLTAVMSHFLGIVHTMFQRCISSLEALFSSASHEDLGSSSLHYDFLEVRDFINDAIVSMGAFVNAYKPAALFFSCPVEMSHGNEELLVMLARLHDTLLPSLQQGFRIILAGGDDGMISNIARVEDAVIRADILIQTFREISGALLYIQENQNRNTFLQNLDKSYHLMNRLQSLQNAGYLSMAVELGAMKPSMLMFNLFPPGWIFIDDEQLQYLSGDPEEVIQRILEGTLHEDLKCLDTSLETMPMAKSALTASIKDKGKGKLVESTPFPSTPPVHSANAEVAGERQSESPSVSSSSTVGRFVRKSNDVQEHYTLDARDDKESTLEENEIFSDKISSNLGKSSGTGTESSVQTASNTKWGSKKKPQYYVKDGKNYSYKVTGSVAVANSNEASPVNQAQGELIYGLGRGGNILIGAVRKLTEYQEQEHQRESDEPETRERERKESQG